MVWTYTVEEAWREAEGAYWYKIVAVKIQTQQKALLLQYPLSRVEGKTGRLAPLENTSYRIPARKKTCELLPSPVQ
jgi:hypothetical protein